MKNRIILVLDIALSALLAGMIAGIAFHESSLLLSIIMGAVLYFVMLKGLWELERYLLRKERLADEEERRSENQRNPLRRWSRYEM